MNMDTWFECTVVSGLQNGRKWGFPTANVADFAPQLTLQNGVYAVFVRLDGNEMPAMMYIGTRPTLSLEEKSVEIHIFEFNQDIYGRRLAFQVIAKVREERRFDSVDALVSQLGDDASAVKALLNKC